MQQQIHPIYKLSSAVTPVILMLYCMCLQQPLDVLHLPSVIYIRALKWSEGIYAIVHSPEWQSFETVPRST